MQKLFRQAIIELERSNGAEIVSASLSSEEPVERPGFGVEILDHSPGSVDLSRTKTGLPLLWQHDPDTVIGRAVDIRLEGKKLRANLKPARNARAAEVWQDIRDGIVKDLSIGYSIDPQSIRQEKDGSFRVMKWKIFETSAVSIAADVTVGIGRDVQTLTLKTRKEIIMERCGVCGSVLDENKKCALCGEKARVRELSAMGRALNIEAEASEAIANGVSVEAFRKIQIDKIMSKKVEPIIATPYFREEFHSPELPRIVTGNMSRKFADLWPGRKDHYKTPFANFPEFTRRVFLRDPDLATRAMSEGVLSAGGALVPVQYGAEIHDAGLEASIVMPRATIVPMESDKKQIPAWTVGNHSESLFGGIVASWKAEGIAADEANAKLRTVELEPGKLFLFVSATREVLVDSNPSLDTGLATAFGQAAAWFQDDTFLDGDGAGKPLGVLHSDCRIEIARDTAADIKLADLAEMYSRMHPAGQSRGVWVCSPTALAKLIQLSISIGTEGVYLGILKPDSREKEIATNPTIFTRPLLVTEKLPAVGSTGDLIFCDFQEYLIGLRADYGLERSDSLYFNRDMAAFRLIVRVDGQPAWDKARTLKDGTTTVSPFIVLA